MVGKGSQVWELCSFGKGRLGADQEKKDGERREETGAPFFPSEGNNT